MTIMVIIIMTAAAVAMVMAMMILVVMVVMVMMVMVVMMMVMMMVVVMWVTDLGSQQCEPLPWAGWHQLQPHTGKDLKNHKRFMKLHIPRNIM